MAIGERTVYCGALRKQHVGSEVVLKGWVRRRRDLGSLVFVDLRDREGIAQCVFSEDLDSEAFLIAKETRPEYVLAVRGRVALRGEKDQNHTMATGEVEVEVAEVEILAEAETPPFAVEDDIVLGEEMRLQHRFLDLRRPIQNKRLQDRHRITQRVRNFLSDEGFLEIETPFLTKSTPEGARDFLVPPACGRGPSMPCPSRPSSSSSSAWWRASIATSRWSAASATRTCGPTDSPNSPRSTARCPSSTGKISLPSWKG